MSRRCYAHPVIGFLLTLGQPRCIRPTISFNVFLMKDGQASQTAIWVCMGRALAHGRTSVARFNDPTALTLLPDAARTKVEAIHSASDSPSFRERLRQSMWQARAGMMVARTVEIDDAIRTVAHPQLVILG